MGKRFNGDKLPSVILWFFGSLLCWAQPATPLSLNEEERAWLHAHPVIRVAQDTSWVPVEFADEHGEPSGMSADYLKLVEQRLGVTFARARNLKWFEVMSGLKRREIDMTTSVAVTPENSEFLVFTKPYMKIPIVIFTQIDVLYVSDLEMLAGKKVAVGAGYSIADWLARDHPSIRQDVQEVRRDRQFHLAGHRVMAVRQVQHRDLVDVE